MFTAAHAHAHAAVAAASAYDASKSAYYQQAAAAYPTAAPPQPQPTYDAAAAKPAYSTSATYAQVLKPNIILLIIVHAQRPTFSKPWIHLHQVVERGNSEQILRLVTWVYV